MPYKTFLSSIAFYFLKEKA
ncbi:hypothetical protein FPSE_06104 [Fusarium pseudograminearum CS3096]|uniref:Uncharacterized protein n=1 Tax=Fusarium pseudograminearum (strain CS3096) TaxID=1028729 RepID=K3W085_FUSPC|nr:hypothetical protein FPSE_06104 [Fusarium pseudograminearum CS3096]EKJ73710.1 hypothetical protein FPSE_06104 [Fusarium pseudograminearum CS3096]